VLANAGTLWLASAEAGGPPRICSEEDGR